MAQWAFYLKDRSPVGDPTANRIVSPARTSRTGVAFGRRVRKLD
jgi:hypothetical protein